ncbi:MAG: peptidylprolyl isomerase [Sandaracinaceae bacterium]
MRNDPRTTCLLPVVALALVGAACSSAEEPVTNPENLRVRTSEDHADERSHEAEEEIEPEASGDEVAGPQQAPDTFRVRFDTTEGAILVDVHRDWAPHGADRFHELVTGGFFTDVAFFRVLDGFMAQAGIHGDPAVSRQWQSRRIPDDPVRQSNTRGRVTFATAGPNTRTTQIFINYGDNSRLDAQGFAPFGEVVDMTAVDRITSEYGETPNQGRIQREGNDYLRRSFPNLTYIRSASIVEADGEEEAEPG